MKGFSKFFQRTKRKRNPWLALSLAVALSVQGVLLAWAFLAVTSSDSYAQGAPVVAKKILFFDDEDVLHRSGTKRKLHQLIKVYHPNYKTISSNRFYESLIPQNPVSSGRTWQERKDFEASISHCSVYKRPVSSIGGNYTFNTNYPYQVWYQAYSASKNKDKRKESVVCYAESADGIIWVKPNISYTNTNARDTDPPSGIHVARQGNGSNWTGRYSFDSRFYTTNTNTGVVTTNGHYYPVGSNNIVMIGSGGYGDRYWASVIVEPEELISSTNANPNFRPERRYKMVFTDWEKDPTQMEGQPAERGSGTQVAFSPDGITWTKYPDTNAAVPVDVVTNGIPDSIADGSHPTNVHRIGYAAFRYKHYGTYSNLPLGATTVKSEHTANPTDFTQYSASLGSCAWGIPISMSDGQDVYIDPAHDGQPRKYVIQAKAWVGAPLHDPTITTNTGILTNATNTRMIWKHASARMESTNFITWSGRIEDPDSPPEIILTTDDKDDLTNSFGSVTGYEQLSTNGTSYDPYTFATNAPPWDGHNIYFHTTPVFKYEDMYLCLNQLYYNLDYTGFNNGREEGIEIELMSSRDSRRWTRFRYNDYGIRVLPKGYHTFDAATNVAKVYLSTQSTNWTNVTLLQQVVADKKLDPDGDGIALQLHRMEGFPATNTNGPYTAYKTYEDFDCVGIVGNSTPIVESNEVRFYYAALGNGGLGLARIERDRLVGIRAEHPEGTNAVGQVTLKEMDLTPYADIAINAKVDTGGEVRVELLNEEGKRWANYQKIFSQPLTPEPDTNHAVVSGDPLSRRMGDWVTVSGTNTNLYSLSDLGTNRSGCRIRIYLKNAELYSVTLLP